MNPLVKIVSLLLVIALAFSCSSPRKCSGKRGIKTPMGTM